MKHLNFIIPFFLLFFSGSLFATDPTQNPPIIPPPPPHLQSLVSVTKLSVKTINYAIIDNLLAIHFNKAIGSTLITITNEAGEIVYLGMTNTDMSLDYFIPIDALEYGTYTITIESESGDTFEDYFAL